MNDKMNIAELTEFASEVAAAAIKTDRSTEQRFWTKLNILMTADTLDFEKAMPTFIQLISQFGEINEIPSQLFSNMSTLARGLNDTKRDILKAQEFPELAYTPLIVLHFRYRNLKSRWNEYVTLALQAANLKTEGSMGLVETVALLSRNSGGGW